MKWLIILILFLWFYINPFRAISSFSDCYLMDCPECIYWDFNANGIINLEDYTLMTGE